MEFRPFLFAFCSGSLNYKNNHLKKNRIDDVLVRKKILTRKWTPNKNPPNNFPNQSSKIFSPLKRFYVTQKNQSSKISSPSKRF